MPEQLDLIDVLPENVKKIRSAIRKRDEHHENHLAEKKCADELDKKIWELVQAAGGKLDNEGTLSIKLGADEVLKIKRGEARLSIRVKSAKEAEPAAEDDAEADDDKTEPPPAPTRRGRSQ